MDKYPELRIWDKEGLFRRSRFGFNDISASQKKRYITRIRSLVYNTYRLDNPGASSDYIRNISPQEISSDRIVKVSKLFDHVHDPKMREIMAVMILSPQIKSARNTARENSYLWGQFVIDFDYGITNMIKEAPL